MRGTLLATSLFCMSLAADDWTYQVGEDWVHRAGGTIEELISDFARLNFGFFNRDTLGVAAVAAPIYCAGRAWDEAVHRRCYDAVHHKNLFCKGSGHCSNAILEDTLVGTFSLALPLYFLTRHDPEDKDVGSLLLNGVISIGIAKSFIKEAIVNHMNYRPFSEKFKPKHKYGGFPSGHAAVLTYFTVFMGLERGPKWAIALGMFDVFTASMLVTCNYHFVSQIVAGAALGSAYALAAHHLAQSKISDRWSMGLGLSPWGNPAIQVSYDF